MNSTTPLSARACNTASAILLLPLFAVTGFIVAIESLVDKRFYLALLRFVALLPDPDVGVPLLGVTALGTAGLLVFACNRVGWLLPLLLLGSGGLAELHFLVVIGLTEGGEFWVPGAGLAGMALAALQLRKRARPRSSAADCHRRTRFHPGSPQDLPTPGRKELNRNDRKEQARAGQA